MDEYALGSATNSNVPDMQNLFRKELAREPRPGFINELVEAYPSRVAYAGIELIGFAYCRPWDGSDVLELVNILVARDWRSSGVGAAILEALELEAVSIGYESMVLINSFKYSSAGEKRSAVPFYTRNGYQDIQLTRQTTFCWKALSIG